MILTLCGSARFEPVWHEVNKQLGLAGHISFSLMTFPSIEGGEKTWYTEDQKWTLDLAHFAKIEASDGIVLLNVRGYLGESSLRELKWARMRGKRIYWLEEDERFEEEFGDGDEYLLSFFLAPEVIASIEAKYPTPEAKVMPENLIVYGVRCVWWDDIANASTQPIAGNLHGLPYCPYCKGVLFEMPKSEWESSIRVQAKNWPHYDTFIAWLKGKCFPTQSTAYARWFAEADPSIITPDVLAWAS